ncbi:glycine cleavage system aminomethyltransferase GcvT [bacterium]|nr:glycine cleavage system aminomethyltransferase GcvT [bacterium]
MLKTALHDWHAANNGRIVDFAGWAMPVQYSTITEEHTAVRTAAGVFDIAHMGRLRFTGDDACRFLDHVVTNDVTRLKVGDIRYALVTNANGGILDDVLVYCFEDHYMLVVNASNREKVVAWLNQHSGEFNVQIDDQTLSHFMLALQGPKSIEILSGLVDVDLAAMKYYSGQPATVNGVAGIVTRTGYTGEDGFEVIVPTADAVELWKALFAAGEPHGIKPAGLGCRDSLRLEAAMPLYGHEMDETTDPFTAGLSFGVKLKAGDFIGKESLQAIRGRDDLKVRVGLELEVKRVAREDVEVHWGKQIVGKVTSGTFSPTLQKSISMAYVDKACSEPGTELNVNIRGKEYAAKVVALPFYERA